MAQIQCPKCTTALRVAAGAASGTIRCPKCGVTIRLGKSAAQPAQNRRANLPTSSPKPVSQPASLGGTGAPAVPQHAAAPQPRAAVSGFPVAGAEQRAYIPPAKLLTHGNRTVYACGEAPPPPEPEPGQHPNQSAAPTARGGGFQMKHLVVLGLVFVVSMLLVGGGIAAIAMMPHGESATAANVPEVPEGFIHVNISGVTVAMPNGEELDSYPSSMECKACVTPSGTVYMLGATKAKNKKLEKEKLRKRLSHMMAGGVMIAGKTNRNGHEGDKAILDQSVFVPDMKIEVFQDQGRIIVLGVSRAANADANGNIVTGRQSEAEKIFLDSFEIGPAPIASFW